MPGTSISAFSALGKEAGAAADASPDETPTNQDEDEVLMMPGTQYRVVAITTVGPSYPGLVEVQLSEIDLFRRRRPIPPKLVIKAPAAETNYDHAYATIVSPELTPGTGSFFPVTGAAFFPSKDETKIGDPPRLRLPTVHPPLLVQMMTLSFFFSVRQMSEL